MFSGCEEDSERTHSVPKQMKMSALTNAQINYVIRRDEDSTVAQNDYSPQLYNLVRNHWGNVRNQLTLSSSNVCSEINYRLSSNRFGPDLHTINYWPEILEQCTFMFQFLRGIFHEHFVSTFCYEM